MIIQDSSIGTSSNYEFARNFLFRMCSSVIYLLIIESMNNITIYIKREIETYHHEVERIKNKLYFLKMKQVCLFQYHSSMINSLMTLYF